ncbi:MAG: cell division protein ZapD [Gammaproteobacteria bacterium]|nr:cell division protein ZapD [Gammaproteobacteria bacterium]
MNQAPRWIVFEQPLTERVRTYLRLEFLFDQYLHHHADRSLWGQRAALQALLDVFSVVGRTDLKTELLKELSEQHANLSILAGRPQVDRRRLDDVLEELHTTKSALQTGPSYLAAALRENDFLHAVMNRLAIPGGTCTFDLPAYHRWLCRPAAAVARDLDRWRSQVAPLEMALRVLLRLLRQSTPVIEEAAESGVFLYTPRQAYQLLRVMLSPEQDLYPEVSASRHRFSIRFMRFGEVDQRHMQAAEPVSFRLQCCALALAQVPAIP